MYERYDFKTKIDNFDSEIYDIRKKWINNAPAFEDIYFAYLSTVTISRDIDSGLIVLEVEHESQNFAFKLAKRSYQVNNIDRARDYTEAQKSLEYLNNQLAKANLFELKSSINQLALSQLEKVMLTEVRDFYLLSPMKAHTFLREGLPQLEEISQLVEPYWDYYSQHSLLLQFISIRQNTFK